MGFRVQRSIGLGKFLRLNISKSGLGLSAGFPGLRISTGPRGSFINLGLPGTGLSYRKKISQKTLGTITGFSKEKKPRSQEVAGQTVSPPERPSPGFFASREEKALAKGLEDYEQENVEAALAHFQDGAEEPGAAILAAAIMAERDFKDYRPIPLLEAIIEAEDEFPTELMQKYLTDISINIAITPKVTVAVPLDGLAAPLLLVELYQAQRRVREAIALLEEVVELSQDPILILSLCELYASRELWSRIIEVARAVEPVDDVSLQVAIFYGRAMQAQAMHAAAIAVLSKAVRRKKNRNPLLLQEAAYWRAISYQAQGNRRRANQEFQRIFAENPDFKDIRQKLGNFKIH